MLAKPNAILYHCNDLYRCNNFVNYKGFMIVSKEEGKWLGNGMYFWDNISNAMFWKEKKLRDNPYVSHSIIIANVFLDKLLDLTDLDVCTKMGVLWNTYVEKTGIDKLENHELGFKLNILFKTFDIVNERYNVIKVYGKYNHTPDNKFWTYDLTRNYVEPISSVKCIYNVKSEDAIGEKEFYVKGGAY